MTMADEHQTIDEQSNHCFGCGGANPEGLHLSFTIDPVAFTSSATVTLTQLHEGAPGYVHGGILATLLDEAMSKLNRPLRVLAMTRHMEVDYLRPAPLGLPLTVSASLSRREGRKLFYHAEIRDAEGRLLTKGSGLFIEVDPSRLVGQP